MSSDSVGTDTQPPSGWRRLRRLLPDRSSKAFWNASDRPRTERASRRPAYPPGYKYGYYDTLEGPLKFEQVHHWPINPIGLWATGSRRKQPHEREITRQLPAYRPTLVDTSPTTAESVDAASAGRQFRGSARTYRSQAACSFFRLPPEIRLLIYGEVFGSTLAAFSPLKYKTRDETDLRKGPSRLGPLLACRGMYDDSLPALKLLLRDLKLVNLAAFYLPWTMPMDWLSGIRSLEIDYFFDQYLDNHRWGISNAELMLCMSLLQPSTHEGHTWYGMWDLIANRMPNLTTLKFNARPIYAYEHVMQCYSEAEPVLLFPLTWVHGPAYSIPVPAIKDVKTAAFPRLARHPDVDADVDRPSSRLERLEVNLWWRAPPPCLLTGGTQLSDMLAAKGCQVRIWHLDETQISQADELVRLTREACAASDPGRMISYRSHKPRSKERAS